MLSLAKGAGEAVIGYVVSVDMSAVLIDGIDNGRISDFANFSGRNFPVMIRWDFARIVQRMDYGR